ncbi:hypothetical protein DFQ50_10751 [Pseudocitrobacter faecalis]|uniref:Uncharacterized protein n=1 Tax=Pseudocitrobacter faecalis TaxID=1398493 RepID=A0ABX9FSG6_9ENTR|nr:hypothetical protein DFQ50_10751 [Pseudocitrobacter faecalis]
MKHKEPRYVVAFGTAIIVLLYVAFVWGSLR